MMGFRRHLRYSLTKNNIPDAIIRMRKCTKPVDIVNISTGGTYVELNDPPPTGSPIELSFSIPGLSEKCDIPCIVRWTQGNGAGLQFERRDGVDTQELERFLQTLKTVAC